MADERIGGVDTSSFPKPRPPQDPMDTINKIGGMLDTLGEIEVGKANQSATNPQTGEIDRNEIARMLQGSIAGSRKIMPTLNALEQLKSAGYAADQAGLETFQKRMAITNHLFSGLASKPKPTIDDVHEIAARALDPALDAKKYGITLPVIMNAIKSFRGPDGQPLSPEKIKAKALEIQTQAASTSEILGQHSQEHELVNRGGNYELVSKGTRNNPAIGTVIPQNQGPNTPVATPGGTRYLGEQPAPPPAAVTPGAGLPPPDVRVGAPPPYVKDESRLPIKPNLVQTTREPPVPTGPAQSLRPGYTEAQTKIAGAGAEAATTLTNAAANANRSKALLGNLEDDLTKFTSGRGSDYEKAAKNFINRNLPVPDAWKKVGAILDEKSIASQEQFAKTAQMIAQSQFATLGGTGTDAKLDSAVSTSPNELLSQLGNKGIIRMLKGNEDAIIAQNRAWQKWKKDNGPDTYDEFQAKFQQDFDPRAFQFQYLSVDDRNKYIAEMDPNDRPAFIRNLTHARKENWIRFEKAKEEDAKPAVRATPTPSRPPGMFNDNGGWPTAPGQADTSRPSWAVPRPR